MSPEDAIDRILELSAEAQTRRREAPENSSAFHKLTGAVLAYGQALDLLTKLRKDPTGSRVLHFMRSMSGFLLHNFLISLFQFQLK